MPLKAYRKKQAFGDLKERVFKAYIVPIRRTGGDLGLLLLQSTANKFLNIKSSCISGR